MSAVLTACILGLAGSSVLPVASAQTSPRCAVLLQALSATSSPAAQQFLLAELAAAGCNTTTTAGPTTTSSSTSTSSTSSTSTSSTSTTSTSIFVPPTIDPNAVICAGISAQLGNTTNPIVLRLLRAALAELGCPA